MVVLAYSAAAMPKMKVSSLPRQWNVQSVYPLTDSGAQLLKEGFHVGSRLADAALFKQITGVHSGKDVRCRGIHSTIK